jgi:hypothetical protein
VDKNNPVGREGLAEQEVVFPPEIFAGRVVAIPRLRLIDAELYARASNFVSLTEGGLEATGATPTPVTPKLGAVPTLGGVTVSVTSIEKLPILVPSALVTLMEKLPNLSFK